MQQHSIDALDLDPLAKPTNGSVRSILWHGPEKSLMQMVESDLSILKAKRPALFPPVNGFVGIGSLADIFSSNHRAIAGDRRRGASVHAKPRRLTDLVLLDVNPLLDIATLYRPRAVIVSGRVLYRLALDDVEAQLLDQGE
jgi:hypothetical protein